MKIAIFGASGLGREIADICHDVGYDEIVFLVKDENEKCIWPNKIIFDTSDNVQKLCDDGFDFTIGIGDPKIRKFVADKYPDLRYPNLIHSSASLGLYQLENINKSKGIIITAGCRITNNIDFGDFILLNLNTTVGHDAIIGDFVSAMPSANISGNVDVGACAYIGTGSSIIHGGNDVKLSIGENSVVGAGAVVTKDVPKNVTVVGVPAKILGQK
ncbi:MAG: acetyltransferase [Emcibacteraceae bacterium]|nr:acetyltransferase [Emcibacteraceae bacterium]MDG1857946.1 acetyltransferase [Emcibacteraceae bacterium]